MFSIEKILHKTGIKNQCCTLEFKVHILERFLSAWESLGGSKKHALGVALALSFLAVFTVK